MARCFVTVQEVLAVDLGGIFTVKWTVRFLAPVGLLLSVQNLTSMQICDEWV
jgi:hypothetical protein